MILRWLGQHRASKARQEHARFASLQEMHDREEEFRALAKADRATIEAHENTIKALRLNRNALAEVIANDATKIARLTAERDELQLRVQSLTETIAMMERADDAASF